MSWAGPGTGGNFFYMMSTFIPGYSVYRTGEEFQLTEHIGEDVHFLFNERCYKSPQKTYSLLFNKKSACTKCVLSVGTSSLSSVIKNIQCLPLLLGTVR